MNGFINIHKERDWTSHDVVAKLRGILGIKKIGHTGTLDPLATGVLVCAVGNGTKLVEYMQICDKEYVGTFELGKVSDTYDSEGEVEIKNHDLKIDIKDIEKIIPQYIGKIKQTPPIFSAIKIKGKKAYELARKGQEVEMPVRVVDIQALEIVEYNYPFLTMKVVCGGGTYIRSLGHDIGQELGVGAIMIALERTRVGEFVLENSVKINDSNEDNLIWSPKVIDFESREMFNEELEALAQGKFLELDIEGEKIVLGVQNNIPRVLLEPRNNLWKARKMLG